MQNQKEQNGAQENENDYYFTTFPSYAETGKKVLQTALIFLTLLWTAFIAAFVGFNIYNFNQLIFEVGLAEARAAFQKDTAYRFWAANHGGVYVSTDKADPNPYLSHIPTRDITTTDGDSLTLVNPAYMTRMVHELSFEVYGLRGHITSLNVLRPENAPDKWETKALKRFEQGEKEVFEKTIMEEQVFLRYMAPMVTDHTCLKCHGGQGYKAGDIRGGISVSIPMNSVELDKMRRQSRTFTTIFISIWLLGLTGIAGGGRIIKKRYIEKEAIEEQLHEKEYAIHSSLNGVAITDPGGKISYLNPSFCKIWNYPDPRELTGTGITGLLADKSKGREIIKSLGRTGGWQGDLKTRTREGHPFYIQLSVNKITNRKGKSIGIMTSAIDISVRKKGEEQIKKALEEKDILIKELYHRTKNNMQVVCSLMQLHRSRISDSKIAEIFKEVESKIKSMALVQKKLYQSQNLSAINFRDYIIELSALLKSSFALDDDRIQLDTTELENVSIMIDYATACGLIINELITNAIKHAFPGNRQGFIKIKLKKDKNEVITFTVADNGIGIKKDFDIINDSGMGLTTVLNIAQNQLRGDIKVERQGGLSITVNFKDNTYQKRI